MINWPNGWVAYPCPCSDRRSMSVLRGRIFPPSVNHHSLQEFHLPCLEKPRIKGFSNRDLSMISRRQFSTIASYGLISASLTTAQTTFAFSADATRRDADIQAQFLNLETTAQCRLGVHILDTATGQEYGYRSDERFMMLSSFKLLASALVLYRADVGRDSLERRIPYTAKDLIPWSPITERHADGNGMTLGQLCEATITTSDNTAGNLILSSFGGPAALTAFARQLGDNITRLDRHEPELNDRKTDNMMDTTSPRAMANTMHKLLIGDGLSTRSRNLLRQWLLGNTTGGNRIKAGLPTDWQIGDKTGTNKTDSNDIGIVIPPKRAPLLATVYLAESHAPSSIKDSVIAAVGSLIQEIAA